MANSFPDFVVMMQSPTCRCPALSSTHLIGAPLDHCSRYGSIIFLPSSSTIKFRWYEDIDEPLPFTPLKNFSARKKASRSDYVVKLLRLLAMFAQRRFKVRCYRVGSGSQL